MAKSGRLLRKVAPHALPFAMARPAPPQPQAWLSKVSTVHWIHDPYSKCKSKAHYEAFIDDGVPRRASTAPHGSGASRANPGERERPRSVSRSSSRRSSRERAGSRPVSQQSSRVHGSVDSAVSSFSRSRSNGELADRCDRRCHTAPRAVRSPTDHRALSLLCSRQTDRPLARPQV